MCKHNDIDEYDCDDCCWDAGYCDALDGEPDEPEYKNFSQVNNYHEGYSKGKERISSEQGS